MLRIARSSGPTRLLAGELGEGGLDLIGIGPDVVEGAVLGAVQALAGGIRIDPTAPVAFRIGQVADQAQQGQRGRRDGPAGQLLRIQPPALHEQCEPISVQVVVQGVPFSLGFHVGLPRVVLGVHPHVGIDGRDGPALRRHEGTVERTTACSRGNCARRE
jgi:hypothetical protein